MAQMIFTAIGSAIGSQYGKFWQAAFMAAGSYIGGQIDQQLFGQTQTFDGPRLTEMPVMDSVEGSPVGRLWGRHRIGGELIWTTRFKETIRETTEGGGKGAGGPEVTTREFLYSVGMAIAFCEGHEHVSLGRIWANGILLDQSKFTIRFYPGSETQAPDPLIVAKEGDAPAYRGIAYVVFEDMALADFGNVIPQISAEIIKPIFSADESQLENAVAHVTLIPATGEFAYGVTPYLKSYRGDTNAENVHTGTGAADILKSLDALEAQLPNVGAVTLVAAWFGDDLRCGACTVRPKVESQDISDILRKVQPRDWRVSGLTRSGAQVVSSVDAEHTAYGGTPSDDTVYAAILELADRGVDVVFLPFLMMDIAAGNTLANPYSNNAATIGQPTYPWRGRITCSPAAGFTGTVDKTATAATQVDAFFGACDAGDFAWNASTLTVDYSGPPNEWSFRRHILHYAKLCAQANIASPGAVKAFVIGTELVNLTTVRSSASAYPAVTELIALAAEASTILGASVKVGYAADWSEYHSHRPTDGSGDVFFHLDPLWSDANIDFVGIDNYLPVADWRDGGSHLDAALGGPYDRFYLQGNIEGGEYYDWFYASPSDRDNQVRTTITDGAGKPWVFRNKDIRNWWANAHHDRPGGVESGTPTSWTAQSKPIWFTELGCGAVDKAANQPNVFVDAKSSESQLPHYSSGARDDLAQRRFIEAHLDYWNPVNGNNPTSGVYSAPMIDPARLAIWTWDARPYPEFPQRDDVWGDSANWRTGHWLNGRVGGAPLAELVLEICALRGLTASDVEVADLRASEALVTGYFDANASSPRELIAALMDIYLFDAFESEGKLKFIRRGGPAVGALSEDDFVVVGDGSVAAEMKRGQDVELPRAAVLRFYDEDNAFQPASVSAARLTGASQNEPITIDAPLVLTQTHARAVIQARLYEAWAAKEMAEIELPPSLWAYDPGDSVDVPWGGRTFEMRFTGLETGTSRKAALAQVDARIYSQPELFGRPPIGGGVVIHGPPEIRLMDLPMLADNVTPHQPYAGATANPWPGAVNVYREAGTTFTLNTQLTSIAVMGETLWDLFAGPVDRWDDGNSFAVLSYNEQLASIDEDSFLANPEANAIAVENQDGEWEVLRFTTATLTAPDTYVLSGLLRGQLGTEGAMRSPVPAGALWCKLDRARLRQLAIAQADRGAPMTLRYGPATAFHDAASYIEVAKTFNAVGLRPYSPTDVAARRDSSGDWHITWIRRTRIGGEDWDAVEVPLVYPDLDEYVLEVLDGPGGAVLRTVSAIAGPAFEYTTAMMNADFGMTVFNFDARIYQMSDAIGRGQPWEGLIFPSVFAD